MTVNNESGAHPRGVRAAAGRQLPSKSKFIKTRILKVYVVYPSDENSD